MTRWLQHGYQRLLTFIVRRPLSAYLAVGAVVLAGIGIVPRLGESLFPTFKERDFLIHWMSKPGTSLAEEQRMVTAGSKALRAVPGVRNFGAHIGQAPEGEEIAGVDFAENWISIDPKANYAKTLAAVERVAASFPGLYTDVQTYLKERISEVLTGESEPIVVRIFGPDLDQLSARANEVKQMLAGVKGVTEAHVELQVNEPQVDVQVDLDKAQHYGIKPGDVRRAAATLVSGQEVGNIYRDGKNYDVQAWSPPESRTSVTDIGNLLLDTPDGGHVRLADVATVSVQPTPSSVQHEDGQRRIDIGANVEGRDLGSVVRDAQTRLDHMTFPLEYHAELLGEYKERQAAQNRLIGFALLAFCGIFLMVFIVFKKLRLVVHHLLTLPIALVGGVIGAWLTGGIISIGSLVGFFTVLGITARNGIMLISHFQHLETQEGVPFGPGLVIRGARERLAPILMTMLATGLALVPLVVAGDVAGQEIEYPMVAVILGGLVTSTLLNLFVVPVLYLHLGKKKADRALLA